MKHTDFRVKHGKLIMVLKESVWKSRNDCRFMWSFFSPENINEVILTVIGSFVYRPIVWALYVRNKLDIWDMWPNGCVDTKQIYVRHMTLQKYIYIYIDMNDIYFAIWQTPWEYHRQTAKRMEDHLHSRQMTYLTCIWCNRLMWWSIIIYRNPQVSFLNAR